MKTLPIERPTLDDPLYSQKNPHQTFLLVLSLFSAAPLLFGGSTGSATLDAHLGTFTVLMWGVCLLFGSLVALIGEFWPGHTWTALVLERAGLGLVGAGAAIYSFVVFTTVPDARFAVSITAAYAASCLWRVGQITRRLRWLRALIRGLNTEHGQP